MSYETESGGGGNRIRVPDDASSVGTSALRKQQDRLAALWLQFPDIDRREMTRIGSLIRAWPSLPEHVRLAIETLSAVPATAPPHPPTEMFGLVDADLDHAVHDRYKVFSDLLHEWGFTGTQLLLIRDAMTEAKLSFQTGNAWKLAFNKTPLSSHVFFNRANRLSLTEYRHCSHLESLL